jgi:hypothetical protein
MLNHVARFPMRGLHVGSARGARCIVHSFRCTLQRAEMLRIATCCEPTGNFIAVLHDGQIRTSSSCRTADHSETTSRIPLSAFGFSGYSAVLQGTLRRLGRLCAAVESNCVLHDASRAARCMLHLVLRVACCISCCALHDASRAARCMLHLVLRVHVARRGCELQLSGHTAECLLGGLGCGRRARLHERLAQGALDAVRALQPCERECDACMRVRHSGALDDDAACALRRRSSAESPQGKRAEDESHVAIHVCSASRSALHTKEGGG